MTTNSIPCWIESKLFESVLKETLKDFEKILDFKVFHALSPGENYTTVMLKVQIETLLKTGATFIKSFMLKVPHNDDFYRRQMSKFNIFAVEAGIYHNIKPELENLYKEIGLNIHFGAESYRLAIKEDYILLEDLTKKGFRNANRLEGLDMEHCKAVLKKIAQWHAASVINIERKGPYEDHFIKGVFNEKRLALITTILENSLEYLIKAANKFKNHKEYIQQMKNLKGKLTDIYFKDCALNEDDFNVLNHGDCWCNNIMFQYDTTGKLQETYFVDYQIPRYGTPAQDLLYFIMSSAQLNIKVNKFDYMIKYYHDNLTKYLTLLKYQKKIPTLKDIHQNLIKYILWGFFSVFVLLPAVLADPSKDATLENFIKVSKDSNKFKELLYSNERIAKHFEIILPWLYYRGAFES